jgi:hypothetical protein
LSAILKALKIIDAAPPHQEDPAVWPDMVQIGRAKQDRRNKRRLTFTLLTLVCGTIAIAAGWVLTHHAPTRPKSTAQISKKEAVPSDMRPTESEHDLLVVMGPEKKSPTSATALRPGSKRQSSLAAPPSDESRDPSPRIEDALATALPENNGTAPAPELASEIRSSPGQQEVPLTQPPEQTRPTPNLPTKDDPKITLQAIAWAEAPEGRFAVINNRIIKEGQSVAGYTVVSINRNAVRFKDGGREWYQLFKVR